MRTLKELCTFILLATFLLAGCSTKPPIDHQDKAGFLPTLPGRLLDQKPEHIGKYKGPGDLNNWWIDKERTLLDWEAEKREKRLPTDHIVIHHTAGDFGMTWQELSQIQYQRLYPTRFKPSTPDPTIAESVAIQSGHFRQLTEGPNKGKWQEVFYAYHWLIRADGSKERLLQDDEVGWQAGNWDINMRSIAICFDGNFTNGQPNNAALKTCAELIKSYEKKFGIKDENVLGHNKFTSTECPGIWFDNGGRDKLLKLVHEH